MKKFLSLVLALVMAMSLVTISAGAEDFTDDSTITYKEAVDVVSEIGIVDGYTDGSFGPTTTLTRGAAAKIICNLLLGPTTASALSADTAPYSDVPTNHVFAGYISYCANKGIISGYADGTFRPAGTLTGYAFMKMLLGALGYDSEIEGFTGPNWSINVAKTALNIGLEDGNDEFVGTKAVTREEACLYAFNTLKSDLVEYDSKTTVSVGGAEVIIGGSEAKAMQWKNSATKKDNIKKDDYVQFAEQYFNKLVMTDGTEDAFSRPATRWDYKGVKVGTYSKTPDLVYTGSQKVNSIYADLNMSTKDTTAKLFFNGIDVTPSTFVVQKSNDIKLKDIEMFVYEEDKDGKYVKGEAVENRIGDGTIVEVYRDDDDNHVDIVAISVYGGKISAVKEATSKKDAYVVVDYTEQAPKTIGNGSNDEFETEEFAEDDIVAYTYSDKDQEIKTMYKMESVEGSLDKKTMTKSLTLSGTTYKYAKEYTFEDLSEEGMTNKSDYTVYLDVNGLALYITESEFSVEAYALVEKISGEASTKASVLKKNGEVEEQNVSSSIWDSNKALLLFADGTEKTVSLSKDYKNAKTGAISAGEIVRYKVEDDGDYKLIKLDDTNTATSSVGKFTIVDKNVNGLKVEADSKTIFVVANNDGDDFDVYTGIKKAPTIKAGNGGTAFAYFKNNDGSAVAKVIFVLGAKSTVSSKDITFIAAKSASKLVKESDTANYYVYNAVVKGEITTVMVEHSKTLTGYQGRASLVAGASDAASNIVLNDLTYDSDDIITSGDYDDTSDVAVKSAKGVKKVSSEEIKLGGSTLSVASNCAVYLIDDDGNIEAADLSDVKTNADSIAIYTMEEGEITNLFVQLPKD